MSQSNDHDTADGFVAADSAALDADLAFQRAAYEQVLLPNLRGWAAVLVGGANPVPEADRYPYRVEGLRVVLPLWLRSRLLWLRRAWLALTPDERRVLAPYMPATADAQFVMRAPIAPVMERTPASPDGQTLWGEAES